MDRRSKTYLILATIIALLAICVAVWALFFRAPETPADPEISPVADEHLTPTDDGDDEKMIFCRMERKRQEVQVTEMRRCPALQSIRLHPGPG